jgi:hypothetical protein
VQQFGEKIWIVGGPTVSSFGFRYPTRMAAIKLSDNSADGTLFIWSPIALTDELRKQIDEIGNVRFIVAPNSLHHLSLKEWGNAYPDASVYAAPGLRKRRKDIAFDGDLEDEPDPGWAEQIDQTIVRSTLITPEVVFFHWESGTALFTDLIQNFEPEWFSGWRKAVAVLDRLVGREAQVPQKFRVAFVNRTAAREALTRILEWPAQKVLMAHGRPITEDGRAFIKRAFRWLIG